jgi:hypothetical protein
MTPITTRDTLLIFRVWHGKFLTRIPIVLLIVVPFPLYCSWTFGWLSMKPLYLTPVGLRKPFLLEVQTKPLHLWVGGTVFTLYPAAKPMSSKHFFSSSKWIFLPVLWNLYNRNGTLWKWRWRRRWWFHKFQKGMIMNIGVVSKGKFSFLSWRNSFHLFNLLKWNDSGKVAVKLFSSDSCCSTILFFIHSIITV